MTGLASIQRCALAMHGNTKVAMVVAAVEALVPELVLVLALALALALVLVLVATAFACQALWCHLLLRTRP